MVVIFKENLYKSEILSLKWQKDIFPKFATWYIIVQVTWKIKKLWIAQNEIPDDYE